MAAKHPPGYEDADHDEDANADILWHSGSAHEVVRQERAHDHLCNNHLSPTGVQQFLRSQEGTLSASASKMDLCRGFMGVIAYTLICRHARRKYL